MTAKLDEFRKGKDCTGCLCNTCRLRADRTCPRCILKCMQRDNGPCVKCEGFERLA